MKYDAILKELKIKIDGSTF